ncbi:MAG: peptidyl-prolyl cis-trans isomerase [Halobacteriovoraceae bacterium]|nr:peptidyl-prolyl cis-trans isomerase [Halobacteriovoraceae bacterium]|tara:strand:- start:67664 stop:68260 length:597 start_codon:yes stop_codon:yes gene_type:complete
MKKLLKPFFLNLFFLFLTFQLTSCFKAEEKGKEQAKASDPTLITAESLTVNKNGLSHESIVIKTVHGNIEFKLYPKKAPNTVTRIIKLTNDGFYDGIKFHRVVPNFVIQAGDPSGTGSGGSGKKLKAEFNDAQHIKGTVAMARTNDPDSADSQFYIALNTLPHLDGKYTVFGQVVDGLDIINKVKQGDVIISMVFNKN